jgi:hypothetical protein
MLAFQIYQFAITSTDPRELDSRAWINVLTNDLILHKVQKLARRSSVSRCSTITGDTLQS